MNPTSQTQDERFFWDVILLTAEERLKFFLWCNVRRMYPSSVSLSLWRRSMAEQDPGAVVQGAAFTVAAFAIGGRAFLAIGDVTVPVDSIEMIDVQSTTVTIRTRAEKDFQGMVRVQRLPEGMTAGDLTIQICRVAGSLGAR